MVGYLAAAVTKCCKEGTEGMPADVGGEVDGYALVGCYVFQDAIGGRL